jgi:CHAD domain-containing protein
MKFKLRRSAALLKAQRRSLLAAYDEEELHQLRITLRRIRSALEPLTSKKARKLRRDLGKLARATNPARDWDTLLASAEQELTPAQFSALRPWLQARQADTRDAVRRALGSPDWKSVLKRWRNYSRRPEVRRRNACSARGDLRQALLECASATRKAMAKDDARYWHRLRISIKALRYTLESQGKSSLSSSTAGMIDSCKRLQTDLGGWHDTVVHRELLTSAGAVTGVDDMASAALQNALTQKGKRCLERTKQEIQSGKIGALAGVADSLKPGSGG